VTDDYDHLQRLEAARQFILGAFDIACKAHAVPRADLAAIIKSAMDDVGPAEVTTPAPLPLAPPLPQTPPETWAQRDLNQRENPTGFTRRVYGPWIGRGLTRGYLKDLDAELYRALSVWLTRHPDDPIASELPRKSDMNDALIEQLSALYPVDTLRKLGHLLTSRTRRPSPAAKP
jgi:hypothetical protein